MRIDDTPWSAFVMRETLIILRPQRAWAPLVVKVVVVKVAILFTERKKERKKVLLLLVFSVSFFVLFISST